MSKHIAPSALFFFRWGAALTVLTGLIVAVQAGYAHQAFTLQDPGFRLIGIGMWLAVIMAFNVWFIIWPNQKKGAWHCRSRRRDQSQRQRARQ